MQQMMQPNFNPMQQMMPGMPQTQQLLGKQMPAFSGQPGFQAQQALPGQQAAFNQVKTNIRADQSVSSSSSDSGKQTS
jgi:hypothetical protein